MAGHLSGVQTRIRENYPKARYIHCASHRLNLTLSNVMSVPAIRNCLGVVSQVVNLFRNHSNANKFFKKLSKNMLQTVKRNDFSGFVTQYLSKGTTVSSCFLELFECIVMALEEIAQRTWTIFHGIDSSLSESKSEFLVNIVVCEKLFSLTLPLSISFK
ncbi:hypothetical protein TNCT_409041 [Trichonephila clavata]|uniref:DUF4371 domain-containing protein n=1 Tax=Trichonephila clavata TaxID=2740835 RepID=A0A8X6HTR0_TRICU|nr:hypothetical protein TNCT_409041 [Trichonephila clavata]